MSSTTVKGLIGAEDINFAEGGTGAAETYSRRTSTGGLVTLTEIDASHLKYRSLNMSVEDNLNGWIPAKAYGTVGTQAAISAALTAIGSDNRTLYLHPGTWNITSNLAIPINVNLWPEKGAVLTIATGVTLTINGPFEAGPYQVFNCVGTGVVVFGDGYVSHAYAEWWGAKGDGTTNCAAALQAAFIAFPHVKLNKGTYEIGNNTIYLNSTTGGRRYILEGMGASDDSTILSFTALAVGAYAFKVNESAAGAKVTAYPGNPRFTIRNLQARGDTTNYPHLMKVRECSAAIYDCHLAYWTDGIVTGDYCDQFTLKRVAWNHGPVAGYLLRLNSNGDTHVLEQIGVYNAGYGAAGHAKGIFYGTENTNVRISNCIGGLINVTRCFNVEIDGWHSEDTGAYNPLTMMHSTVLVRNSLIWDNQGAYPIVLDDDNSSYNYSTLILRDNIFSTIIGAVDEYKYDAVRLIDPIGRTFVILDNNISIFWASGRWIQEPFGITISSNNATINTELGTIKSKRILSSSAVIQPFDNAWKVLPLDGPKRLPALANDASLDWTYANTDFASNLAAGTYYYTCAIYFDDGLHTAKSAEVSAAVLLNQALNIGVTTRAAQGILRVWRGTAAGVYTRYVDIPTASYDAAVTDCGTHMCGYVWITVAVPTPPTANTTMEGVEYPNGKRVFWAAAAPTSAEFTGVVGDIVWDTNAAAGGTPGWYCTTAGSPGTWTKIPSLSEENYGVSAAIATGATIAHGLSGTPTYVLVTPAETGPSDVTVSAVGAATFVVNFGGGGNKTFYWWARKN